MARNEETRGSEELQIWRSIDLGHHSLRWLNRTYSNNTPFESNSFAESKPLNTADVFSQRLTRDRLALCELASLTRHLTSRAPSIPTLTTFEAWQSLDQLMSSPFLGALSLIDKSDGQLWVNTSEGEFTPRSLFSRWLNDILVPAVTIGEERQHQSQSLIWLTSPGRLPSSTSLSYKCLSELPYAQGASLNSSIATLIGINRLNQGTLKRGVWGVLDVGEGQASWSLIEVAESHVENHLSYRVLKSYGRNFVGSRGLRRALLNHHLTNQQCSWTALNIESRREWVDYVSTQADLLIKRSWPRHLKRSVSDDQAQSSPAINELFQRYSRGTYLGVMEWIHHSLKTTNIGPEALRGIYVTGQCGLGLSTTLRRGLNAVNIKVAPHNIALLGAQEYIEGTLYGNQRGYHIEDVSPFALIFRDNEEEISKVIFTEQSSLPVMRELEIGPTTGSISFWLSNYSDQVEKIAEHPSISKPRRLHLYYEGPHLFELTWVDTEESMTRTPSLHSDEWVYV